MLAAHFFEESPPCPEEVGVAIHAVERKGSKLLPALRATLGGERLAALAWTPGRNSAPGATLPLPEAGTAAPRALSALAAEAPDNFRIPNLRIAVYSYHGGHRKHAPFCVLAP